MAVFRLGQSWDPLRDLEREVDRLLQGVNLTIREGEIVARQMMNISLSFDHRVIDGAVGARFVAALKAVLEQPEVLLVEGL